MIEAVVKEEENLQWVRFVKQASFKLDVKQGGSCGLQKWEKTT